MNDAPLPIVLRYLRGQQTGERFSRERSPHVKYDVDGMDVCKSAMARVETTITTGSSSKLHRGERLLSLSLAFSQLYLSFFTGPAHLYNICFSTGHS
jgi:hypothetical protein